MVTNKPTNAADAAVDEEAQTRQYPVIRMEDMGEAALASMYRIAGSVSLSSDDDGIQSPTAAGAVVGHPTGTLLAGETAGSNDEHQDAQDAPKRKAAKSNKIARNRQSGQNHEKSFFEFGRVWPCIALV